MDAEEADWTTRTRGTRGLAPAKSPCSLFVAALVTLVSWWFSSAPTPTPTPTPTSTPTPTYVAPLAAIAPAPAARLVAITTTPAKIGTAANTARAVTASPNWTH